MGEIAKISRPIRTTTVLITNFPDWIDEDEVVEQIRASDPGLTKVSARVRDNTVGGKMSIIDISMEIAERLPKTGQVKIGWSLYRVKLLERKKSTCHRCLRAGHFKTDCKVTEAERLCYR